MKLYNKFKLLVRQYGFKHALLHVFHQIVKPIYQTNSYYILAIDNYKQKKISNSIVEEMNCENADLSNEIFGEDEKIQFNKLLATGKVFFVRNDREICAWGGVQTNGIYYYRGKFTFKLPQNVNVLKNLYVKPQYRGMSYGKYINEARINDISDFFIPIAFVIPENKYAIRNLKIFGFDEFILIKHVLWFGRKEQKHIKVIKENDLANILLRGLDVSDTKLVNNEKNH